MAQRTDIFPGLCDIGKQYCRICFILIVVKDNSGFAVDIVLQPWSEANYYRGNAILTKSSVATRRRDRFDDTERVGANGPCRGAICGEMFILGKLVSELITGAVHPDMLDLNVWFDAENVV
ncbi:hypothetical protein RX06_03119 [Escherichia coli]|nr:hypothetical protein RX06_03119 [Escherichia coli]